MHNDKGYKRTRRDHVPDDYGNRYEEPRRERPARRDDGFTMGEFWSDVKDHRRERKEFHQKNTTPKDLDLLKTLPNVNYTVGTDGSGGEKYTISFTTDRGQREVHWWTSTGLWKACNGRGGYGKGEGRGLYSMARYFQLIKREGANGGDQNRPTVG
jgi:hypothetical protein